MNRLFSAIFTAALAYTVLVFPALGAGNIIQYTYDAAGNITQMQRQSVVAVSISSFSPGSGAVGNAVTISGSGFNATPANNVVAFNGTPASVTSSSAGSIVTAVPAGATTGTITVTVGSATATSTSDFVVTIPGAPSITSFSPSSGIAGDVIAVTGADFDPTSGATTVRLNGVIASASVASSTSLSFTVPVAGSGKITAATATGTGVSSTDFIVPPAGVAGADIIKNVRIFDGGPAANVSIHTVSKYAMVVFDANANGYYTVQFGQFAASPTSATIPYKVINPDNGVLVTGNLGAINRPTIHLPKLAATGTYSILLSPGSATLNTNVSVAADPVLVVDGATATTSRDTPSQSARFAFDVLAGQRLGIGVTGTVLSPNSTAATGWNVFLPNGTPYDVAPPNCSSATSGNTQATCDGETIGTVAGTYTIVASPPWGSALSATVMINSEVTGTLSVDSGVDVTLARVGQDARYAFSASAGDSLAVDLSGLNPLPQSQSFPLTVYKPDGSYLAACSATAPGAGYCELGAVPVSGVYSVSVDPSVGDYGTFRLTLKQGALLDAVSAPSSFSLTTVAEAARFRFSGTTGENLVIGLGGLAYVGSGSGTTYLTIARPDGASIASASCNPASANGYCKVSVANLAQSGTYAVVIQPPPGVTISGTVQLSTDLTGSLSPSIPQTLSGTRLGQNARFTFSGTAGDSTSIKLVGVSATPAFPALAVTIYKPDGSYLASSSLSGTGVDINLFSLPVTGTYTVAIVPNNGVSWQGQLTLDPGTAMTVDGSTATLGGVAGEVLRFRFPGTAGQRVDLGVAGFAYAATNTSPTYMTVYRSNGAGVGSATCYTWGTTACDTELASLPANDTYIVTFLPPTASAISAGTLAISSPLTGTLVVGDPAQNVSLARPGQTARFTFSGTALQALRLNWSGTTVTGGPSVDISVLKPDGTALSSGSFANGATGGFDIAALPSTGTYTVVFDPVSSGTMSAPITLVTR